MDFKNVFWFICSLFVDFAALLPSEFPFSAIQPSILIPLFAPLPMTFVPQLIFVLFPPNLSAILFLIFLRISQNIPWRHQSKLPYFIY
jgi:hypothetical protein